jgi:hypothetical protein|tara:strand:+ start:423 stop:1322 length:900 start_codon:yes stop_codon:yes gene_type:complete
MNNEIITIDADNYNAMAKVMGMSGESSSDKKQSSTLARLRINHTGIMGEEEIKGKLVKVEVVEGGTYKLEIPDGATYFAKSAKIRPFMQRFMYKRFIMGAGDKANRYVKTIMGDNLNIDLKDNDGGFNCGKPSGWIKDFKALPEKMQDLIRQIKRVRVVFGTIELVEPTDNTGEPVEVSSLPFIWEVENRDAFKTVGDIFTQLAKMKRLPVHHLVTANTEERKLPNGNSFYLPVTSLDVTNVLTLDDSDQKLFADFVAWVQNYNEYILNAWSENANKRMEDEDMSTVDDFVDIDADEVA